MPTDCGQEECEKCQDYIDNFPVGAIMAVIILILSVIIYKAKGNKNTNETEAELAEKKP